MGIDRAPSGVGIGFRAALAEQLLAAPAPAIDFVEVAPENYLGVGGQRGRWLAMVAERFPVVCHGLCGDFSGAAPLDRPLLDELGRLLRRTGARFYSDHLCLTHVAGRESHDLLPLPFSDEAIHRAARRIRELQDLLGLPLAVENVSAYVRAPGSVHDEATFVRAVVEEADCKLLLDVNNVYVNSVNFGFDPERYIDAMPLSRVVQIHIAGHDEERLPSGARLLVDTHGQPIVDPVYRLMASTWKKLAAVGNAPPILLERDHNIPPLPVLLAEVARVREVLR